MKTETIVLMNHHGVEMTPSEQLEAGSFYLINHTRVLGKGHEFVTLVVFIDALKNAHCLTDIHSYWTGSYSLKVVRKIESITLNF